MTATLPEPWLRGPLPDIPPLLQPAGHALVMALEDTLSASAGLTDEQLWAHPGGAGSVGFHLAHLAGSTDRLLTYARGEGLSDAQLRILSAEKTLSQTRPALAVLAAAWRDTVEAALYQLGETPESILTDARFVGRARLPSTVIGLLFHAAEHASRHTGQLVTMAKVVRG
ncbi:MAG: DinB family protein [Rhodothermales bacterium]|nr:DinB family protein [Rhodothermales bacterium]